MQTRWLDRTLNKLTLLFDRYPEWLTSAVVMFLLAFSAFAHVLLRPWLLISGNDLLIYYFWEHFTREQLAGGQLPLWNPYILSGYPAVGNPQVMIFYPPAMLLRLLPLNYAFGVGYALHVGWLGLGTYWLTRWNGLTRKGAYVAAIAFMFSGFVIPRVDAGHVDLLYSVAWMPWAIGLWQKTLQTGSWQWAILSGIVVGLHFLGGHPSTLILTVILMLIASGHWLLLQLRPFNWKTILARGALGLLALFVVVGGFAVQLLPTIELIRLSTHAEGLLRDCGLPFALTLPDLSSIALAAIPFDVFLPWERNGYFGAFALILALIGLTRDTPPESKRFKPLLIAALAAGLLFGFNPSLPFLSLGARLLPAISFFRVPSRFMLYVCFAGAGLAGIGFESIAARIKAGERRPSWPIFVALALAAVALPADALYLSGTKFAGAELAWHTRAFASLAGLSTPRYLLAAVLFWLFCRPRIGNIVIAFSLLIVYADLWFFGHPYIHAAPEASLNNPSAWITGLDAAQSRIVVEPYMFANGAMATHAANAQGYASIILATYADVVDRTPPESRCGSVEHAFIPLSNQHLLKLLSVQFIMNAAGPMDIGLPPLQSGLNAYETADYWPRAIVVNQVKTVSSSTEAAEQVNRVYFDPTQWAIIETKNLTLAHKVEVSSSARITSYQPMRVVVEVDTASDGMLVLNDVWYPGWRGTVNGVETPVYRANGAFRAVRLARGHSTVIFTFESDSLKQGAWASAATWFVVATLVAVQWPRITRIT